MSLFNERISSAVIAASVVIAAVLLPAVPAAAAEPVQCTTTCYVDSVNGSDANGGTSPSDAKGTIQAGVGQVSANGTVIVAAGTYQENVTVSKDGLTIQGAGRSATVLQGTNCGGNGVTLVGSRNGLTLDDLGVTGFENGIYLGVGSDTQTNITIDGVGASSNCRHGIISQDGVITNLTVTDVTASDNGFPNSNQTGSPGRGLWIINGIKTNVSITDSTFSTNFISGIDFGDGNVTGLTVARNTVDGNGDAGISLLGAKGPGANLVADNTVRDNGRFGIEVKASTGTGNETGAGSLVVSRNVVQRAKGIDPRDYAGIAVIRRSGQAQYNDDQPSGAVVANNEVSDVRRASNGSTGDGFGIVVEGSNNVVQNNVVSNDDVGLQVQGGCVATTQSTPCFDRGDAALGSATVRDNSVTGNGIGLRTVGTITPTPLIAEGNWWGNSSGPQPTGSGDSVVSSTPNGVDYDPWLCSGADTSTATGFQPSPQTSPCPTTGTIQVTTYGDVNRNGARDNGEPGLSGWTITVKQGSTTVASSDTGSDGTATFGNLVPGPYTVCETLRSGWQNTDPSDGSGCKTATVTGSASTSVLLGNASVPTGPAPAQAGRIYAVNDGGVNNSQLFTIDPNRSNAVAALGPLYRGYDFEALDIDPVSRVVYVTSGVNNAYGRAAWLWKVDGVTGAITPVGSTGQKGLTALNFRTNGELWGWSAGRGLVTVNKATGAATLVFGDSTRVEGLTFTADGTRAYLSAGTNLYEYTFATRRFVRIASNLPGNTEGLEARADGKLLLGVDGRTVLYVYDPATRRLTSETIDVRPYDDVEGIGYPPPSR